ncbi:alpha-(1,3)-fucosyltransferase 7-like [Haliotis asinina]|uniref:alpha-(1,3)-fucosyltransferase 7-like n=1 Tax=Haliotis asinina TaxID=109174 RepID=UPI003531B69E
MFPRWPFRVRQRKVCLLLLIIVGIVLTTTLYNRFRCSQSSVPPSQWSYNSKDPRFVTVFPDAGTPVGHTGDGRKLVLLWTPFFTGLVWDADHNVFQDCPVTNCEVTTNRHLLTSSHSVLFNVRDLSDHPDSPLPSSRTTDQIWILHNTEPPNYIYLPLSKFNGVFNWTSWYRKDATVFSPYGRWVPLSPQDKILHFNEENYHRKKTKMVLWVSSNCNDRSKRMNVVQQLKQYIDIDIYGKCGNLKCKKDCREVFDDYKFYLSFENGYCRDYLTEKFWRPIIRDQIPVVRGGADYKTMVPPGSYINVDDFSNVRSLAEYLWNVARNESLYNSYFSWKKNYKLVPNGWTRMNWCGLCERLHDAEQPAQVYSDLKGWVEQDTCPYGEGCVS